MSHNQYRREHDLIGAIEVPAAALYGGQTQRALNLYPLNGEKALAAYPELIIGLLQVKKAAAITNTETGELPRALGEAITDAIDRLLAELPLEQFPVHAFHGGGGISANMNVNEVIANLANLTVFDQPLGSYTPIHPNDHVNLNNSTSDALSTACHLATIKRWQGLQAALAALSDTLERQGEKWREVLKIARTCLQDAVEISFADLFGGYAALVRHNSARLGADVAELYNVNLGGNIIGRPGDCSAAFFDHAIPVLNRVMAHDCFRRSDNLFAASQSHDGLIRVAGGLDQLARGLLKIAKDFRLMSSGPETGFREISLPAVQPGSSAMPGKVNPTIPEYLVHCCMQACGRCYSARMTHDHGELDYSPWQSIVITNLLDAMACLENGIRAFTGHCLNGVQPDIERNSDNINSIIPTIIRLKKARGYSFAAQVFKESGGDLGIIRSYLDQAES